MVKLNKLSSTLSTHFTAFVPVDKYFSSFKENIASIKSGAVSFKPLKLKRFGDVATFVIYKGFSQRFVTMLKENGVSNFTPYRISVKGHNIPPYYYLDVKCAPMFKHTSLELDGTYLALGPGRFPRTTNYLSLSEWGGEDLVTIQETANVLVCTEKVVSLAKKHKMKFIDFEELKGVAVTEKLANVVKHKLGWLK